MGLMLHAGAEEIRAEDLRDLETPEATATHVPIPHARLVDLARHTLTFFGHTIESEAHGITPDSNKYFGVMMLRSEYGGYEDVVGLRNSHDKSFPVGFSFGSHVFVCDNMAFSGDHVIKRQQRMVCQRRFLTQYIKACASNPAFRQGLVQR